MTALTLTTAPLVDRLQQMAAREQTTAEALLVEAVTEYLARDDQSGLAASDEDYDDADGTHTAFLQEKEAFQHLKPTLLAQHQGKFVAIYEGQVVAVGDTRMDAYGIVLEKFGEVPCYIEQVATQAPRPKRIPSVWKAK